MINVISMDISNIMIYALHVITKNLKNNATNYVKRQLGLLLELITSSKLSFFKGNPKSSNVGEFFTMFLSVKNIGWPPTNFEKRGKNFYPKFELFGFLGIKSEIHHYES